MSEICWSEEGLEDSDLLKKLYDVRNDVQYEKLYLYCNKLTSVPDLRTFSQFDNLKVLILWNNNIRDIDFSLIPHRVTWLDLSDNQLTSIGDLSHCTGLEYLDVGTNEIIHVEWKYLPTTLTRLDLDNNHLTTVGDCSQCAHLSILYLQSNHINNINARHLPSSLTELYLQENELTTVGNCSHCTRLSVLDVHSNHINDIDWRNLPPALTRLYLDRNQLTAVGDCSQCTQLSELYVCSNKINNIDWRNLPPALTGLDLYSNQLTTVDLCHCSHLEYLDLDDNPTIYSIQSFPNKEFQFIINSSVTVLEERCFHENTYNLLKRKCRKFKWQLEQPPVEVLLQGLEAVLEYYKDTPIRTTHTSLMLLGPTAAGKSSMMKSLIEGKAVLVHTDDRTQVADIQTWEINPKDSIQLFDHGGNDIYRITCPIFMVPNGTVALVHDISQVSEDKVDDTTAILRHALAYHPENQVHLVLTHTDVVSSDDAQKNRDLIETKVWMCIDQEIQSLRHLTEKDEARNQLAAHLQKQRDNMEVFLLSSKTLKGMDNIKQFLAKVTEQKRVSLPEKWIHFYRLMLNQKKNFFKITELQKLFKQLYFKAKQLVQQGKIMKKFRSALKYHHAAGHVLYFPDNPVLKDYVFHNKDFLLQMTKSVFHHNLQNTTDFSDLRQTTKVSVELMLQQYTEEGLLAIELLQFLWQKYGLKEEEERAVLEIMKKFHICYPVDISEKLLFFPFFLKSNEPPASSDLWKLPSIHEQYFSVVLNCVFHNVVPINAFEAMQVQVQKTAVERKYGNNRYAWQDGIQVIIGTLEIKAIRRASESTITVCVCAPSNDVEQVWQVMSDMYSDLEAVIQPLLGVIKLIYFDCTHCIAKHLQPVYRRSPSDVLKTEWPDVTYDCCRGDKIPRALVIAPPAGSWKIKEHVRNVQEYLKTTFQEISPPGKLLYLDCEEVSENQFDLSWGWSVCGDETGPLVEITHAVVEYREGQEWTQLSDNIKKSPYKAECNAEEFRVAAVNKNGYGEYSYVTPYHVVHGDKFINDRDRDNMKANHEFFTRMSNVSEILLRLYTRGVIQDLAYDRLSGAANKADQLLKCVIYRSTYRQLYLFQKTLEETGQSVMAATVPVTLQKNQSPSQESSNAETAVPLL